MERLRKRQEREIVYTQTLSRYNDNVTFWTNQEMLFHSL